MWMSVHKGANLKKKKTILKMWAPSIECSFCSIPVVVIMLGTSFEKRPSAE